MYCSPAPTEAFTLSAAIIARDEEGFLPDCLESIRNFVDEIVVVDTGSRDRTRAIAVEAGARVFDFVWCDDFSAARNFALDQCSGQWILYIDADERIVDSAKDDLAQVLSDPKVVGGLVRFHAELGLSAYPEIRLFRRDPAIRFRGCIHETVMPDLERLVASQGARIVTTTAKIIHLGYEGDQAHKLPRNLPLLEKAIKQDPERVYLRWHLGATLRALDRADEAEAQWKIGAALAQSAPRPMPEDFLCFTELARLEQSRGESGLDWLKQALALQPHNWYVIWLISRALAEAGKFAQAWLGFDALGRQSPEAMLEGCGYHREMFGPRAYAVLGDCAFKQGALDWGERAYGMALDLAPEDAELKVKHAYCAARNARRAAQAA